MNRIKGSVTVFTALVMPVMFMALFVLIEAGRNRCIKACSSLAADQAVETVISCFNTDIEEKYQLMLFWDEDIDEGRLKSAEALQKEIILKNYESETTVLKNSNILKPALSEVDTKAFQLVTDNNGDVFIKLVAKASVDVFSDELVDGLASLVIGNKDDTTEEAVDSALNNASDLIKTAQESGESGQSSGTYGITAENNPIEWVKMIKRYGVTALVISEDRISDKCIDISNSLPNRKKKTGNMQVSDSPGFRDKVLFHLYLGEKFSSVSKKVDTNSESSGLDYELEYILAGKKSDADNLKWVIRRLILMREPINMAYLIRDPEKSEAVTAMAMAICSAVGYPEVTPILKYGLIAAWAYAESIADVRVLVNGGKLSLTKTSDEWKTDLFNLPSTVSGAGADKGSKGLSYNTYLQILMFTGKDKNLAYRAMDMMEQKCNVKMDEMVTQAEFDYLFTEYPVFGGIFGSERIIPSKYEFHENRIMSMN